MGRGFSFRVVAPVVVIALIGAGATAYVVRLSSPKARYSLPPPLLITPPAAAPVHTADWYVAHPDVLKADSSKCGGNAASLSPAACQNVAAAEEQLAPSQLQSLESDTPKKAAKGP